MQIRLNLLLKKIKNKYMDLKISTKILLIYLVFLIFSLTVCSFIYQSIYSNILTRNVNDLSIQTLYSIRTNILTSIDNINFNSKLILNSIDIQESLSSAQNYYDPITERKLKGFIGTMLESAPGIISVHIFDNYGNRYGMGKISTESIKLENIKDADWYQEVVDKKGFYILRMNSGGLFEHKSGKNYVSFIKRVMDLNTQKPIGILVINMSEDLFKNCYNDIVSKYNTEVTILDEKNKNIASDTNFNNLDIYKLIGEAGNSEYISSNHIIKGKEYLISYLQIEKFNWKIISHMPFSMYSKELTSFSVVALVLILINGALLFFGVLIVSRLITTPIKGFLESMKGFKKGEFKRVIIETGNDEIGELKEGFNIMVLEIEKLIQKVIGEQKTIRKAELNVLQAQVKPHFLYNTLDSARSLAMMGKTKEVNDLLRSLGNYYRITLSKGNEVISIGEEIEVVKNYLQIQKVRYGDILTVNYEIDETLMRYKVLKLVLQPLVENSIYHGIKPLDEQGVINIVVKKVSEYICLIVEDNGVGMRQIDVDEILNSESKVSVKSFGLKGTIERIKLFYGFDNPVEIHSKEGIGTKIIITIPMIEVHTDVK